MNKPLILVLLNILVICSVHVVASEADVIDAEVKLEKPKANNEEKNYL